MCGQMALATMGFGRKIIFVVLASTNGMTAEYSLETGRMTKWMGTAITSTLMESSTMVSTSKIRKKASASTTGPMVGLMWATGRMENRTGLEFTLTPAKELLNTEFGSQVSVTVG